MWHGNRSAGATSWCSPEIYPPAGHASVGTFRRSIVKQGTSALTIVLTAAMGAAGIGDAAGNSFTMNTLPQGYKVAAANMAQDGKSNEDKSGTKQEAKPQVGKDTAIKDAKAKDGKCGEGKCGSKKSK
jgi:uncharacterized low-complexity protein